MPYGHSRLRLHRRGGGGEITPMYIVMSQDRRCGAPTISGGNCRHKLHGEQTQCWLYDGPQCAVCFSALTTRNIRKLPCEHEFHTKCVERWKRTCSPADPTCPMCRAPFDLPTYRCRLMIERVSDSNVSITNFTTSNVTPLVAGFGLDLRSLLQERVITDIHFDIDVDENLNEILQELGLPYPTGEF